jgi:hypothetical protein
MRAVSVVLVGVFALVASAQSTTSGSAATPTTTDPVQASMIACIEACTPGDVSCTSKCIAVPNPNESQVNATNNCVAACPQGNGTESDIRNYETCVSDCIGQNYFTTSGGTPSPTGGAGSGSGSGSSGSASGEASGTAGSTGASGTAGGQASPTDSSAPAASSTGAASKMLRMTGSAAGLFGFLAAVLAL